MKKSAGRKAENAYHCCRPPAILLAFLIAPVRSVNRPGEALHLNRFLVGSVLQCQQMVVEPLLRQQRLVGSLLQNAAVVHD